MEKNEKESQQINTDIKNIGNTVPIESKALRPNLSVSAPDLKLIAESKVGDEEKLNPIFDSILKK